MFVPLLIASAPAPAMTAPYALRPQVPDALSVPISVETLERVKQQKTLTEALRVLAEATRLQILIEGSPRKSFIRPLALAPFPKEGKAVTTGELITALARGYGYEVAPSGPYLLLTKRYDSPDDFPEVTMEETRHFLRSVLKMAQQVNPEEPSWTQPDERAASFIASLTLEQLTALKEPEMVPAPPALQWDALRFRLRGGARASFKAPTMPRLTPRTPYGLRIGEMSHPQQQFLREWGAEFLNQMHTLQLREGYTAMAALGEEDYRFYYAPFGEDVYLTAGRGEGNRSYRLPLPFRAPFSTGSNRVAMSDSISPAVESSLSARDTTRYGQPRTEQTQYSLTLGELAERTSAGGDTILRVSPALSAKRVTLLGIHSLSDNGVTDIRALSASLARLYNLTLVTDTNGREITLTVPKTPTLGSATEMPEAVDRIMPAPLQRLHIGLAEMGKRSGGRITHPGNGDKTARATDVIPQSVQQQIERGLSMMQREAMRRLHTRLTPLIRGSATHSVTWKEMDEESRWLVRFLLSDNALALVYQFSTRGTQGNFARFTENRATVKISPDRTRASIQVIAPEGAGMSFSSLVYLTHPK